MHLLRVYRIQQGLEVKELARRAGLTVRIITDMEKNQDYNASRLTMLKLSGALGLPSSMIFFPEDEITTRAMYAKFLVHFLKTMEAHGLIDNVNKQQICDSFFSERGNSEGSQGAEHSHPQSEVSRETTHST